MDPNFPIWHGQLELTRKSLKTRPSAAKTALGLIAELSKFLKSKGVAVPDMKLYHFYAPTQLYSEWRNKILEESRELLTDEDFTRVKKEFSTIRYNQTQSFKGGQILGDKCRRWIKFDDMAQGGDNEWYLGTGRVGFSEVPTVTITTKSGKVFKVSDYKKSGTPGEDGTFKEVKAEGGGASAVTPFALSRATTAWGEAMKRVPFNPRLSPNMQMAGGPSSVRATAPHISSFGASGGGGAGVRPPRGSGGGSATMEEAAYLLDFAKRGRVDPSESAHAVPLQQSGGGGSGMARGGGSAMAGRTAYDKPVANIDGFNFFESEFDGQPGIPRTSSGKPISPGTDSDDDNMDVVAAAFAHLIL